MKSLGRSTSITNPTSSFDLLFWFCFSTAQELPLITLFASRPISSRMVGTWEVITLQSVFADAAEVARQRGPICHGYGRFPRRSLSTNTTVGLQSAKLRRIPILHGGCQSPTYKQVQAMRAARFPAAFVQLQNYCLIAMDPNWWRRDEHLHLFRLPNVVPHNSPRHLVTCAGRILNKQAFILSECYRKVRRGPLISSFTNRPPITAPNGLWLCRVVKG